MTDTAPARRQLHSPGSRSCPNIGCWLVKHGSSDDDIARAIGGNAIRALRRARAR